MAKDDNLIRVGIDESWEIFDQITKDYPEIQGDDTRRLTILFGLMKHCIVALNIAGWTERELIKQTIDCCEMADEVRREMAEKDPDED